MLLSSTVFGSQHLINCKLGHAAGGKWKHLQRCGFFPNEHSSTRGAKLNGCTSTSVGVYLFTTCCPLHTIKESWHLWQKIKYCTFYFAIFSCANINTSFCLAVNGTTYEARCWKSQRATWLDELPLRVFVFRMLGLGTLCTCNLLCFQSGLWVQTITSVWLFHTFTCHIKDPSNRSNRGNCE